MDIRFSYEEFAKLKNMLPVYEWGLKTLMTKFNIMHEDLHGLQGSSAIDHIRSRIKAPESIARKLHDLGLEITAENAKARLRDIAGVRILTPFARDIYDLAAIIRSMPDINILTEKDFISTPKPSGYRSFHIILEVPVFYSGRTENVMVEVQIRTEAMNFWATLEHKARYKYKKQENIPLHLRQELEYIAEQIAWLDGRMFGIYDTISLINPDD